MKAPLSVLAITVLATVVVCASPPAAHGQSAPDSSLASRKVAARNLDSLGMAAYALELDGYIQAGDAFYQDPEDAQGARRQFFLTSVFLLRLAVRADSTNASAAYHLGVVLAARSQKGWGEWDTQGLRDAARWLRRASRLAVGRYASLAPNVQSALAEKLHELQVRDSKP